MLLALELLAHSYSRAWGVRQVPARPVLTEVRLARPARGRYNQSPFGISTGQSEVQLTNHPTPARDDRGQILILTALTMTVLLGISALAIDASFAYDKR